jgi:hypothetical protein
LPFETKFSGSNPAEDDGFLRAIKYVARFPYDEFYGMLKTPRDIKMYIRRQNSRTFLTQFLPASLLGVPAATGTENSGG